MQNKPLLSIVTSIYNGGEALKQFLQSVSNQTYDNIEVVLVEDCSTDRLTQEIVTDLELGIIEFNKPFKLIRNDKNLGLFKSFQKGLDNASGKYFAFPESDDYLDDDFYEVAMNEIIQYKKIDVVKGLMINKYSDRDLLYSNEMSEQDCKDLKTVQITNREALPIPIKSSNGQIISYVMPDITYSWFYVFSKELLSDRYNKPMFENAVLYGFSNSVFNTKYKEARVSLDKASFYYYNAHNTFEEGGCVVPIIDNTELNAKNKQLTKLTADKLLLEKILNRYNTTIKEFEIK